MNRKINKLYKTEKEILSCYTSLCNCEMQSDYGEYFYFSGSMLQHFLEKEENILSKLSDEELKYLLSIENDSVQVGNRLISNDGVATRIRSLASSCILKRNKDNEAYDENSNTFVALDSSIRKDSKQAVKEEYLNILLSFYDEYLRYNSKNRYNLVASKYRLIYANASSRFENNMVREGFFLARPRELNSEVEDTIMQVPKYIVNTDKRALAYSILTRHSNLLLTHSIDELEGNNNLLSLLFQLRSSLLLLEEKESLEYITKLGIDEDNPWYGVLMEDREKYNDISIFHYRKEKINR